MTQRAAFKQSDITRALRGVERAGMRVGRIEIDQAGNIVILPESQAANDEGPTGWEDVTGEEL